MQIYVWQMTSAFKKQFSYDVIVCMISVTICVKYTV